MKKDSEMVTKLREYFLSRGDTAFAFLYGSYAAGTTHKHSDVAEDFMQMRIDDFLERCSA